MKLLLNLCTLQLMKQRCVCGTTNITSCVHQTLQFRCLSHISSQSTIKVLSLNFSHHVSSAAQTRDILSINYFHSLRRKFASLPPRRQRPDATGSPISWYSVGIVFAVGSIMILALKHFMFKKEKEFDSGMIKSYGRPELGGDFELIDQDGQLRTNRDFIGKWILIYFGFTHCPDICPEELEKMGNVVDSVNRNMGSTVLYPVFISIDPARDTPAAVKQYISDFHPNMIGLTGSREQVDTASRAFRVYYSVGPEDEENDYLVDHTVIMYLIDNDGEFCQYYGQNKSAGEIASNITATVVKKKKLS